jgi:hypothetical protein
MTTTTAPIRMRDRIPAQTLIEEALAGEPAEGAAAARCRAAEGQRQIAGELALLPAGWTVFHSLPLPTEGVLDHVVVGPTGVFPVVVAHHPGRRMTVAGRVVTVAGTRLPTVLGAEADADRVGRLLAAQHLGVVPVQPVVVAGAGTRLKVAERPRGVLVVAAEQLRARLLEKPVVLAADEVASVVRLLDAPEYWGPTADAQPDLLQRFAELETRTQPRRLRFLSR